ncbi:MAG: hypothetical protein ACYS0K_07600 [Planctomycetota bacterium]|jgi:hypothetical protein
MTIQREGGFLIDREGTGAGHGLGPMIGIESDRLRECVEEYHRSQYVGVFGSSGLGFRESSVHVLAELRNLRAVWFWDVELQDVDALYELESLEGLGVHGRRPAIEWDRVRGLRELSTDWRGRDSGLRGYPLQDLYLWHHKPRSKSVGGLELPDCANEVHFNWTNVTTLVGLQGLRGTRSFEIHRSPNIESLDGLEALADSLERLIVTTCGRLQDTSVLDRLPHLKLAIVDGQRLVG